MQQLIAVINTAQRCHCNDWFYVMANGKKAAKSRILMIVTRLNIE